MSALEDDYLTVDEAASLLRVAPSTVRRWIRQGEVPAFRLGKRRVALRRTDLSALITPLHAGHHAAGDDDGAWQETVALTPEEEERRLAEGLAMLEKIRQEYANEPPPEVRKLTEEEKERALQVLEEARQLRQEQVAKYGIFPPSWITINEMRDERTRQLMGE
jgi:excisionase family DNA binding protein